MPKKGANLYKRKDGRWEARITISDNQRSKRISLYGKTCSDAKKKMRDYLVNIPRESDDECSLQESFCDVAGKWLDEKRPFIKQSSSNKYANLLENYVFPSLGTLQIADVSQDRINNLVKQLLLQGGKRGQPLSNKTIHDILFIIKAVLHYRGITISSETILQGRKNNTNNKIVVIPISEQKKLEDKLLQDTDIKKLGVLLCLYTGMRIGEICSLKWGDIDLNNKTVYVKSTMQRIQQKNNPVTKTLVVDTPPKSNCSKRIIPLADQLVPLLFTYRSLDEYAYFLTGEKNRYVEPRSMENAFKKILEDANLPYYNFHSLRHTFATRCVESGFEIKGLSEVLGHSTTKITLDRYVHPSMETKRGSINKIMFCGQQVSS